MLKPQEHSVARDAFAIRWIPHQIHTNKINNISPSTYTRSSWMSDASIHLVCLFCYHLTLCAAVLSDRAYM